MNYQHNYHAGNFADVFKHYVLYLVLKALQQKDKPYAYLDTHAGSGSYDLSSLAAQKTREYQQGIAQLWQTKSLPARLAEFVQLIKTYNYQQTDSTELRYYPGSPLLARMLCRARDRCILVETEEAPYTALKACFQRDKQIQIHQRDGYQALNALLPPTERRGVVLIDPPYEAADEFKILLKILQSAYARWPTGIFLLWYPLKDQTSVKAWQQQIQKSELEKVLIAEVMPLSSDISQRLIGSGMLMVNPPWQLETMLRHELPALAEHLSQDGRGSQRIFWLCGE